jgi:hypothetical protein
MPEEMNFQYTPVYGHKYKYRLTRDYIHELGFIVPGYGTNNWATLIPNRCMILKEGYEWDGATLCPDIFDDWLIRASAVHDGLCQLINQGYLSRDYRLKADRELKRIALEDGCPKWLATIVYTAVRAYAKLKY